MKVQAHVGSDRDASMATGAIDRRSFEERVRMLLGEELGYPPAEISAATRLFEDLGADSLTLVEVVARLSDDLAIPVNVRAAQGLAPRIRGLTLDSCVEALLGFFEEFANVATGLSMSEALLESMVEPGPEQGG